MDNPSNSLGHGKLDYVLKQSTGEEVIVIKSLEPTNIAIDFAKAAAQASDSLLDGALSKGNTVEGDRAETLLTERYCALTDGLVIFQQELPYRAMQHWIKTNTWK